MTPVVIISATEETVTVTVPGENQERLTFTDPGMLTGADLEKVLTACGIRVRYKYQD
jgi:hypothetical protein